LVVPLSMAIIEKFFAPQLAVDVEKDTVLWAIDRLHWLPLIALGGLSYLIGGFE
jgi:stearoyl-CoA desaturase (delta-9 desaturase)